MDDTGDLHIYAQTCWHDDAYIAGTRKGLEDLRDAISRALSGRPSIMQAFTGDGEGYDVYVFEASSDYMGTRLMMPYTDEHALDGRSNVYHPASIAYGRVEDE